MTYNTADYFAEHEYDTVRGFTIIESGEGQYHIAEKWQREDAADTWLDYWIEADALTDRIEAGECEPDGSLTDAQFEQVCDQLSWEPEQLNQDVIAA